MSAQLLSIDRIEFEVIKVTSVEEGSFDVDQNFPQLGFDFDGVKFFTRNHLNYPSDELDDPRHFLVEYGLKIDSEIAGQPVPYEIEIIALGFLRYLGGDEFKDEDRFRAVRLSAYQTLHGAIREMIVNLTARGRHGIWSLPSRNFNSVAKNQSVQDEESRQSRLTDKNAKKTKKVAVKKVAAKTKTKKETIQN